MIYIAIVFFTLQNKKTKNRFLTKIEGRKSIEQCIKMSEHICLKGKQRVKLFYAYYQIKIYITIAN